MKRQSGSMDNRAGIVADNLLLASSAYPWFATGQTATTAIDIAAAIGLSAGGVLTASVAFGWVSYSLDVDPDAGTTLEIVSENVVLVKHYLSQKGERTLAIPFTFLAGTANNFVRIANGGTTSKKTLCLHNIR